MDEQYSPSRTTRIYNEIKIFLGLPVDQEYLSHELGVAKVKRSIAISKKVRTSKDPSKLYDFYRAEERVASLNSRINKLTGLLEQIV